MKYFNPFSEKKSKKIFYWNGFFGHKDNIEF
jgi:hypothetical protein